MLSQQIGVEMPVCDAVFAVCYENVQPREAVARLMGRFAGIE
jgi:glycerol-3-phosphate dehydrogenase